MIGLAGRLRMGGRGIRFVGSRTTTSGTVTFSGLTGGIGSEPQDGDLIIVTTAWCAEGAVDGQVPAGFIGICDIVSSGTKWDGSLVAAYAFVSAGSPTSATVNPTGNPADVTCVMVYRGVDAASPFFTTATTATGGGGSTNANPPAIAAGADRYVYFAVGATFTDGTYTGPVFTSADLDNMASDYKQGVRSGADPVALVGGADSRSVSDPSAWSGDTITDVGQNWAAVSIALRAA